MSAAGADESSFFAHERENNQMLCVLRRARANSGSGSSSSGDLIVLDDDETDPQVNPELNPILAYIFAHWERVLLLVPQSISLDVPNKWVIDTSFLESHVAILGPPNSPFSETFVTKDGIWGKLVSNNQFVRLHRHSYQLDDDSKKRFDLALAPLPPLSDLSTSVFARNSPLGAHEEADEDHLGDIHILRMGSVKIGGHPLSMVLLSQPLYHAGAKWTVENNQRDKIEAQLPTSGNVLSRAVSSVVKTHGAKTRTRLRDFLGQFGAAPDDTANPLFPETTDNNVSAEYSGTHEDTRTESGSNSADGRPLLSNDNTPSTFFQLLQKPEAADVAKLLRTFVSKFVAVAKQQMVQKRLASMAVQAARVHKFIADIIEQVLPAHPLWQDETATDDRALEGLEKYLTTKLYAVIFRAHSEADDSRPSGDDGAKPDAYLNRRLLQLSSFLTPAHFDLDEQAISEPLMKLAITELQNINDYKAPRDKLVCILNCCKVAYRMLRGRDAGADEFLPILIWIVIRARPAMLVTNLEFIGAFRNEQKLHEEMGYYFTQLCSAATFVERCDASVLSIDKEEFAMQMILNDQGDTDDLASNYHGTQEVRRSVETWAEVMHERKKVTRDTLDMFAGCNSASLSLGDVPQLLLAYKLLLNENAQLRARLKR